jgi:hypothetical protein
VAGIAVQPGRVVIVDAENGCAEIHRRVHALGLDVDALDRLTIVEADGFSLADDLGDLHELLASLRPTLLVLDSWRSMWRGDERDEAEVASVLDPLRNLVRRHDAGGLLIHHARRDGSGYRGSGAIAASVELAFLLDRDENDPNRYRRRLRCEKSRPAAEPEPRWLRLASEADLAAGYALIDEAAPYLKPERERAPVAAGLASRIVDLLAERGPMTRAEIGRIVEKPAADGTLRRAVERAESAGSIEQLGDTRWALVFHNGNRDGNSGNEVASLPGA